MPQLVAAAAATVIGVGTAATVIGYGTTLVASIAFSRYQQRRAQRQEQASLQDRTTPVRQSDAARTIVYGRTRVSGPIVYHKTYGTRNESVSHVIPLAGHEITAVDDVWFNDKSIAPWSGGPVSSGSPYFVSRQISLAHRWTGGAPGSSVTLPADATQPFVAVDTVSYSVVTVVEGGTGDGYFRVEQAQEVQLTAGVDYVVGGTSTAPTITLQASSAGATGKPITATYRVDRGEAYARVYAFLGLAAGERDTNLETWSGGEWTSAAVGRNVARLHVRTDWQETLYATGFPGVSAIVRGKKVYDPRLDSTNNGTGSHRADTPSTWAYSDNPALCAVDYLRDALGFGCASTEIDWPSVIAAANVCDEVVPIDAGVGVQKRYTVAGVLSTETDRKTNLEAILDAMVGIAVYSGGRWTIRAGAYVTPTLDLDEGDLAGGDVTIQARANRRDLFNAVRGRYREPTQLYQVTDFPPYASSTYAAEDAGETIYREIDLQMVDDARRAQRIAKLILFRARQALTIQATFKLSAYALQPGDTCRLTIARYGWTTKVFRVLRREFSSLSTVRLTLQEDASAIYAWSFSEAVTPDPAPNTGLPDPRYVALPAGITFRSDQTTFYVRPDSTVVPYAEVSWTKPAADDVYVELYWKRTGDLEYRRIVAPIGATYAWIEDVRNGDVVNVYLYAVNGIGARSTIFWRPSYRVDSVVQDNVGGAAVNWIENATCTNGIDGWLLSLSSPNVALRHTTPSFPGPQWVLSGTPAGKGSGLHVFEIGDRPANEVGDLWVGQPQKLYPVVPGQRLEGSAYLCTHRCTADLRVSYYGATGNYITENVLWGPGSVNDSSNLQTLAQYGRRGGFSTVPAGAARAMLFVRKYARNAGLVADGSYVFAINFQMGPAFPGQADLSPWSDGPLRTVNTLDLVPDATGLSFSRLAPADISLPLNRCDTPLVQATLDELGARDGDHVVYRVTGTVSAATDLVRVALTPTLFTDQFGQPKRSSEWATLPAGNDQLYTVEGAFTVVGGSKSNPLPAFFASVRSGTATLHRALLVVQIKR
ncbi:MAG: phage tail protein [Burkholderiaceae bacterium]|nr:phage tail protein [Burkholderiaceae bacterium]